MHDEAGGVIVILFVIVIVIAAIINSVRQQHLIDSGQAEYVVKVAASGKGTTYHALSCNRCRGGYMLTLEEARSKRYAPCASCGGKATVRRK